MAGKIRQAAVCATAAYLDADGYRRVTGITNSVLLDDPINDAKVHVGWLESGTAVFAFRGTDSRQDAVQVYIEKECMCCNMPLYGPLPYKP